MIRNITPQFETFPANKVAYLILRKCGCSSIKQGISAVRDSVPRAREVLHKDSTFIVKANKIPQPDEWFTFTFVRHPVSRFLSFYSNKILSQDLVNNATFLEYDRFGLLPNMTIDQVIDNIVGDKYETEPHVASQSGVLGRVGFDLDFIGKLENMASDLKALNRELNFELQLPHINKRVHPAIMPTARQYARLAEYYQEDIDRFDYARTFECWKEDYCSESQKTEPVSQGFIFENEATLVDHFTERRAKGFVINLKWRVHQEQNRIRQIRLMRKSAEGMQLLHHYRPVLNLGELADQATSIAIEKIFVSDERLQPDEQLRNIFYQVYFCDEEHKRAPLVNYSNHRNMLLLSLLPIENKTMKPNQPKTPQAD